MSSFPASRPNPLIDFFQCASELGGAVPTYIRIHGCSQTRSNLDADLPGFLVLCMLVTAFAEFAKGEPI